MGNQISTLDIVWLVLAVTLLLAVSGGTFLIFGIKYQKSISYTTPDGDDSRDFRYIHCLAVSFTFAISCAIGWFQFISRQERCIVAIVVVLEIVTCLSAYLYGRLRIRPRRAERYEAIKAENTEWLRLQKAIEDNAKAAEIEYPPLAEKMAALREAQIHVSEIASEITDIKDTIGQHYEPLADAIAALKEFEESPHVAIS